MSALHCAPTALAGVLLVQRRLHADPRGTFARLFDAGELAAVGWTGALAQVNHSRNQARGTVRGLHYQRAPMAEAKLVSCVRGRIWDVALDLRRGSPSFLRWHAQELSAQAGTALLVPPGCAHGYQALSEDAEIVYCHSAPFAPELQDGVHPCDPRLAIAWPLPVRNLSARDASWPRLRADFLGVDASADWPFPGQTAEQLRSAGDRAPHRCAALRSVPEVSTSQCEARREAQ